MVFKEITYDAGLAQKLELLSNVEISSRVPVNKEFSDLAIDIAGCMEQVDLVDRHYNKGHVRGSEGNYRTIRIKDIFEEADKHKNKNRTNVSAQNVLLAIHPFFMHLSDWDNKSEFVHSAADEYLYNLDNLLKSSKKLKNLEIIFMDTPFHYASISSLYMKNKYIQDVIFTQPNTSVALNRQDMDVLKGKNIFIIGMYNSPIFDNNCLSLAIGEVLTKIPQENVYAIKGLCLKLQQKDDLSIIPKTIYYRNGFNVAELSSEQYIGIPQFLGIVN